MGSFQFCFVTCSYWDSVHLLGGASLYPLGGCPTCPGWSSWAQLILDLMEVGKQPFRTPIAISFSAGIALGFWFSASWLKLSVIRLRSAYVVFCLSKWIRNSISGLFRVNERLSVVKGYRLSSQFRLKSCLQGLAAVWLWAVP